MNVPAISHIKQSLGWLVTDASLFITLMTAAQVCGLLLGATMGDRWENR